MAEREKTSPAHRFGGWAGSWWRRWRALEDRQVQRVQNSGMRYSQLLVRSAFRLGELALLVGVLLMGYWIVLPVLLTVGFTYLISQTLEIDLLPPSGQGYPNADEIDHMEHQTYWPDFYDESGNLK